MNAYTKAALAPLLALLLSVSGAPASASDSANPVPPPAPPRAKGQKGCQAKESMLVWKLAEARENGRTGQVQGLERALANVRTWCTDGSLKAKADLDLWEKEQEVAEREKDLQEARAGGKPEKIAKRERKLEKARRELEQARTAAGK